MTVKCATCKKSLVWEMTTQLQPRMPRAPSLKGGHRTLKAACAAFRRKRRAERRKLAIRCLDCLGVYCQSCARKHFVVIQHAQAEVDKHLAKIAGQAMRIVGPAVLRTIKEREQALKAESPRRTNEDVTVVRRNRT